MGLMRRTIESLGALRISYRCNSIPRIITYSLYREADHRTPLMYTIHRFIGKVPLHISDLENYTLDQG